MKSKLRIAWVVLLAMVALPAMALELGQIEVKSVLNQPLVAAIALHPKNLGELEGLTVALAPAEDFARAGLQLTAIDQTLRFHVVTDNNGQKLILVTSGQPISDPYLDFLVQVNTREGRQVREFVVLLNPTVAAPAPTVQQAPTPTPAAPPAAQAAPHVTPAAPPTPPAPAVVPAPRPQPATASGGAGQSVAVVYGDTLYRIAQRASQATGSSVNQMMLALKAANPDAFFKDNINDLKAGSILRVPVRDAVARLGVTEANAEVHRQYAAWRAAKAQAATVLAGSAAEAAARTAPRVQESAPASDHLALVPPSGRATTANDRPGAAGGTGTVAGLRQQLASGNEALVSLQQSNADLASRVDSLKQIADKSGRLLSLKDATVAQLRDQLATVKGRTPGPASSAVVSARAGQKTTPWYAEPLVWLAAGVVVVLLLVAGLRWRRQMPVSGPDVAPHGPLPDLADGDAQAGDLQDADAQPVAAETAETLHARLALDPSDADAHLALCRLYYTAGDADDFIDAATDMRQAAGGGDSDAWHEILAMGQVLAPDAALFAVGAEADSAPTVHRAPDELPEDTAMLSVPSADALVPPPAVAVVPAETAPPHVVDAEEASAAPQEPASLVYLMGDPVDTKLDLARAYLDMGDRVGARAMLDEVLEEGTQVQKDEAKHLLADALD